MGIQEAIHIPVAALQDKLSFVSTDPLPWKNYVLVSSAAVWAFETYLLYVETFVIYVITSDMYAVYASIRTTPKLHHQEF
jgi:hypothetical protein